MKSSRARAKPQETRVAAARGRIAVLDMPPTSPPRRSEIGAEQTVRASRAPEPRRVSRGPEISYRLADM
jgi:hypothetical protein